MPALALLRPDIVAHAIALEARGTHCGLVWNEEVYQALGQLLAASPR